MSVVSPVIERNCDLYSRKGKTSHDFKDQGTSFPFFTPKQRLSSSEIDHNIIEPYPDYDEEIFINIGRKRKMSNDKIQCYVEKWEEIYADEKDKFDALLSEYINAKAEQGHTIKESLLDLYKKGIIAKGVVKEKAKLNEYEFLIALSENGIECSYLRISDEELKTIKDLKDRF